ncbi:MAG: hypothetical protein ABSF15_27895, partial [Candidatus Sulfotelmatobacter sp.]
GSVRGENPGSHGELTRARSWKRRKQPKNTYCPPGTPLLGSVRSIPSASHLVLIPLVTTAGRKFLCYLAADHPQVNRLDQLRREPHILGWMSRLRSQTPPLSTASCINQIIALRCVLNDLAWTNVLNSLA